MIEERALEILATRHLIQVSAEIEVELTAQGGARPLLAVMVKARGQAADALVALAQADTMERVRDLQQIVARYTDLIDFTRQILLAGMDAEMAQDAIDEIRDLARLSPEALEEMAEMGLTPAPQRMNDA